MAATIYSYATKSWPIALGCSPNMRCAPRCWAVRTVNRLAHSPNPRVRAAHEGLVVRDIRSVPVGNPDPVCADDLPLVWTGATRLNEARLLDPLRWRKPQRVAVGYHGDLFRLPFEEICRTFAAMAIADWHQYFVLTKAVEEMREFFRRLQRMADEWAPKTKKGEFTPADVLNLRWMHGTFGRGPAFPHHPWPLPNVWLGVSVDDQAAADERIPVLLQTPAAHRWVSLEPLIGAVDLIIRGKPEDDAHWWLDTLHGSYMCDGMNEPRETPRLDWVVIGGESGPRARPCYLAWIRDILRQCREAGVPCFVKQLGAHPVVRLRPGYPFDVATSDRKGAAPEEWPADIRVREMPEVQS